MKRVFLSYAREDHKLAEMFRRMIDALPDLKVFMDEYSIHPSANWKEKLNKELQETDGFVALVSTFWTDSEWCQYEFSRAHGRGIPIVPVYLSPVPFDDLTIAVKYQGFKCRNGKAITEHPEKEWDSLVNKAVGYLKEAFLPSPASEAPLAVERLVKYAAPGAGSGLQPMVVYHCGIHTGKHPPGKQLAENLEDLLSASGKTEKPVLHDVTKKPGSPAFRQGQTVFVVDSPAANPFARDILLNYQRYMVGTKIHHVTTLDRGIQVQAICVEGKEFCSNRHRIALDDRDFGNGFDDYLVIMRLPGIVLTGDFSEEAARSTVWLVYGTTYRGSFAGASLFSPSNFQLMVDSLSKAHNRPPDAFQAVYKIPHTPELVTQFEELEKPVHFQVLQSLRDRTRGDPVPVGLGAALLQARDRGDYSRIPIGTVHLDLVASCNYNCPGCIEAAVRKKGLYLSYEKVAAILIELSGMKCKDLHFYGGEPTLHPQFLDIAKQASQLDFHPMVVTNGSMLTHQKMFQGLKNLGDRIRVRVSIDAHSQETYVKQHGPKSKKFQFEAIRDATAELARDVPVGISFLVTEENAHELPDAMRFWKGCSVSEFNPRVPMGPHGRWQMTEKRRKTLLKVLRSIKWAEYEPHWAVTPDWLWDWISEGTEPSSVWAFSTCYSAYYRFAISPYNPQGTTPPDDPPNRLTKTSAAWLSLCPYHRYDESFGCPYPDDLAEWCKDQRHHVVRTIDPAWCEKNDKVVCSRVAHNTTVQAEIKRIRFPDRPIVTPKSE